MRTQRYRLVLAVLAIIAILVVVLVISFPFDPQSNLPVRITYTLEPSTVLENEPASLTFSITNANETFHEVQFVFNTEDRVDVYAGSEQLLVDKTYNFSLGDYERFQVREFTIVASLEENVASTRYQIKVLVNLDGQVVPELTKDIYLTVTES